MVDEMQMVNAIWTRIHNAIAIRADIARTLRAPATTRELEFTENVLGIALPTSVKTSYLIHDGQMLDGAALFGQWQILELELVRKKWLEQRELLESGEFTGREVASSGGVRAE